MTEKFYKNIEKIIPQRAPMILIDQYKRSIDADTAYAGIHFSPEAYGCHDGWVSESMRIEAVAQTAAAHIGYEAKLDNGKEPGIGMLATVDSFTWYDRVKDTEKVEIQAFKTDEIGPFKLIKADITVGKRHVARGRIKVFNPPWED